MILFYLFRKNYSLSKRNINVEFSGMIHLSVIIFFEPPGSFVSAGTFQISSLKS